MSEDLGELTRQQFSFLLLSACPPSTLCFFPSVWTETARNHELERKMSRNKEGGGCLAVHGGPFYKGNKIFGVSGLLIRDLCSV